MNNLHAPPNSVPYDILVVDDTPANLRLLSGMLSDQGYKVRPAPNGKLALMGARAVPPDLILLDINMPDMNGYQVCEQLKNDPATAAIPVIFISALDQTEDKIKAFTLGGVDYITKPFQLEEVLARVETHLTLHRLRREMEKANQELRQINQELEATNQELAVSNADLQSFAHTVAHDLKNPLSSIIGFSSLTETRFNQMENSLIRENLHRITHAGYKMRNIIDELLLFASVREMDSLQIVPIDTAALIKEVLERLDPQIQELHAEISFPATWPTALGYPGWIEEVWSNYISNALKYGGHPPVIKLTSTMQENHIKFLVVDNGSGLSEEEQNKVFVPFTRLHQAKAEGHGLGLSIVHRIIEKLGGEVGVTSTGLPGQGSSFWFTLPVA